MIISDMRFDSFEWKHNPLTVSVDYRRRISCQNFYKGSCAKAAGCDLRVIKGKGEFAGEDCIREYERLCHLFEKGRKGLLTLPFASPFYAYFTELVVVGDVTPDLITYSFEFTEAESTAKSNAVSAHRVSEGETLFDIGYIYDISVDKLVALNPQIKRPDELCAGEEVRLC